MGKGSETLSLTNVLAGGFAFLLSLVLGGCSAQSGSGSGTQSRPAVQESGAAVISAGTTWDTAPEPALHKVGGIPPADLTAEPKYGGTLLHGTSSWARLDPHFSQSIASERWFARLYADGLLEWDLKCNCPKPELAESWKGVDDVTFDFKIRKDVKFHNLPPVNARPMTIQDVKWSFDRLAGLGERPAGQLSLNYERFTSVKEFQIKDDSTLRMVLKQPDSMILRELMYDYGVVMPREARVDDMIMEQKTLIGTGPFIVDLAQNVGQSRFRRNPGYWKQDAKGRKLPFLDAIRTLGAGDAAAIQAALKTGQVHWTQLAQQYGKVFENDPNYRIYNTANSGVGTTGFWMNTTMKPFDDVRVRRAINLGVDRDEFGMALSGPGGYYNWTFLGTWEPYTWSQAKLASMPGYAPSGPAKDKEYEEAKRLLAEAGYPNGFEFLCECESVPAAEVLSEQMKRIGLKVNVKKVAGSADMRWTTYMKDKQFAYATIGGGHTPDYALTLYYRCTSPRNLASVCDERIEALSKEFRATYDEQKQVEILHQALDRLWELMPVANATRPVNYYISYTWVRGWRNNHYDTSGGAAGNQMAYMWLDK